MFDWSVLNTPDMRGGVSGTEAQPKRNPVRGSARSTARKSVMSSVLGLATLGGYGLTRTSVPTSWRAFVFSPSIVSAVSQFQCLVSRREAIWTSLVVEI